MRHLFFTISFLALFFNSKAQSDNKIVIGKIDSIQSTILNEKRTIWVHVPDDSPDSTNAKQHYPVVYLLDNENLFSSYVSMLEFLSRVMGNTVCPEMIVVGIGNTDRMRDLTPTHVDIDPSFSMDSAVLKTSGGGEIFISFIEKELIPYIDAQYPTAPYKMLIGHSLGGLMVIQSFVHHTNLFNSYICIDPSMWWDKQTLLKEAKKALADRKFSGTSLFLGIANTMDSGMDIAKVTKDTSIATIHIRSILELRNSLEHNTQNALKYQSKYYNDDSHTSVPLITEYHALRSIFDYYPLKLTFKDFTDSTINLAYKYQQHFSNISKQMGYVVKPPERLMNDMGRQALSDKQFKKAKEFFKYNVDNYPGSNNVYVSMGDYYEAIADKSNAISNYKKGLSIKDNADTRKKLEKLQSK